jgi:[ribosomal protein S5]-alanine N-acetyltransferase
LICVTRLGPADSLELLDAIGRSRTLHEPWMVLPSTEEELREYLSQQAEVRITYGIREAQGRLTGVVNINSIMRGHFQNAFLGYYALSPYERHGYMRAGLAAVLELTFVEHGLHRLEANIQPENVASARLVRGLGFRLEGHSPRYLEIGGQWKDHDRYALTVEEWRAGRSLVGSSGPVGPGTSSDL